MAEAFRRTVNRGKVLDLVRITTPADWFGLSVSSTVDLHLPPQLLVHVLCQAERCTIGVARSALEEIYKENVDFLMSSSATCHDLVSGMQNFP